jgi:hypothetical protein
MAPEAAGDIVQCGMPFKLRGLVVPGRVVAEIYREVDPTGTVERRANRLQRRRYVN